MPKNYLNWTTSSQVLEDKHMWKTVKYNNKYEVSDTGIVRKKDSQRTLSGCISSGYRSVKLTSENSKQQRFYVHRLVAEHFIPNEDKKKTFVNHIDGNKLNNNVNNLEWVSPRENNLHYYKKIRDESKKKKQFQKSIPVIQFDLYGTELARYDSISKAHKATGISVVQIARNIHNEITHTGDYVWKIQ